MWIKQFLQELRGGVLFGDGTEKLLSGEVMMSLLSRASRSGIANLVGIRDNFVATEFQSLEKLVHQGGLVRRKHSQRVANLVVEARALQRDFEMTRCLCSTLPL